MTEALIGYNGELFQTPDGSFSESGYVFWEVQSAFEALMASRVSAEVYPYRALNEPQRAPANCGILALMAYSTDSLGLTRRDLQFKTFYTKQADQELDRGLTVLRKNGFVDLTTADGGTVTNGEERYTLTASFESVQEIKAKDLAEQRRHTAKTEARIRDLTVNPLKRMFGRNGKTSR